MPRHRRKTRADFDLWRDLIVKVVWRDVMGCDEISEKQFEKEPDCFFISYGVVISKTQKNLSLAAMQASVPRDNKLLRNAIRIPAALIQTITVLEEGETTTMEVK